MKVIDFDKNQHNWPPKGQVILEDDIRPKSSYHIRCRELLKRLFPTYLVREEVSLPGTKLTADFYIHSLKLVIEVHGEEHYKYIPFFHGSTAGYRKSLSNDRKKKEWCSMNNIRMVELPFNENDHDWEKRINAR